jgi:hypothetical protein
MRDSDNSEKVLWGQVEKIGKGTRANYDPYKKTITFAFTRCPETSTEKLKTLRGRLVNELKELGYSSFVKFNGEVVADKIEAENVVLVKKNHKLIIQLKNKQSQDKENATSKGPT